MTGPIRVALVDDQPLVRMGLATIVNAEDDLELAGGAADGREALLMLRRTRPDVVLCDIRMPVLDGLGLLEQVSQDESLAGVRLVMLTTFELDEYVFEALRLGASGFLLKDAEPARLLEAIRVVADGGSLLAPSVTRRVIEEFGTGRRAANVHPRLDDLTGRERELVAWVATGRSNAEIAARLVISRETVRTHVSRGDDQTGRPRPRPAGRVRDRVRPARGVRPRLRPGALAGRAADTCEGRSGTVKPVRIPRARGSLMTKVSIVGPGEGESLNLGRG